MTVHSVPPFELELISDPVRIAEIGGKLAAAEWIAYDTEFIRESTFYPKLEVLQLATPDGAWLIDARAVHKRDMAPILDALTHPSILKIVHAAHGDQECLLSAYDLLAAPVFDTAVGASLCGLGDNIGLGNLLRSVLGIELPKGYARTNWSKRPLPKPVLEYALLDVKHLIEVARILFERLDENGRRAWALDLSSKFSERSLYEVPPEEIAKRLAQSGKFHVRDYAVLLELVRWREARVRELNVPRRWLAEDGVLIDLAKIKPATLEQLQGFRGLSKGETRSPHGDRILEAVLRGISSEAEVPIEVKRRNILQPNAEEGMAMDLLRVVLDLLSEEFQISAKHIVQPQNLLPLLRLHPRDLNELAESGLVSPQLGDKGLNDLVAFLKGESSLSVEGGKRVRLTRMGQGSGI
jgi:ribonuclease D